MRVGILDALIALLLVNDCAAAVAPQRYHVLTKVRASRQAEQLQDVSVWHGYPRKFYRLDESNKRDRYFRNIRLTPLCPIDRMIVTSEVKNGKSNRNKHSN
jgi:hypothetical protein